MGMGGGSSKAQPEVGFTFIHPLNYDSITQGTWSFTAQANANGGILLNTGKNQNDEIVYKVYLSAGTYTIKVVAMKNDDQGIINIMVDGVKVDDSIDLYAVGGSNNNIFTATGVSIATTGIAEVSIKMATKNGAASAYQASLNSICFYRTA